MAETRKDAGNGGTHRNPRQAATGCTSIRARWLAPVTKDAAYLNAIGTATPANEVHGLFTSYAPRLIHTGRERRLFDRMVQRCGIERRYSVLAPGRLDQLDDAGLYRVGRFADTAARMRIYQERAADLAFAAAVDLDDELSEITHLMLVSCTGFAAPGVDLELIERLALRPGIERTMVGFMGCHAAINALRLARHIVRSQAEARVLVIGLELCTLHLQETSDLEQLLSFLIFADGCAAALVTREPRGLELGRSTTAIAAEAADQITWRIGNSGFDMTLSGAVPSTISSLLPRQVRTMLHGRPPDQVVHWAVHPGGRSVLDAVQHALDLHPQALSTSRDVLRRYGNMSSATILFVLKAMLEGGVEGPGCAIAFGPGLTVESLMFEALA
jgi:alpha-pyrone synthase